MNTMPHHQQPALQPHSSADVQLLLREWSLRTAVRSLNEALQACTAGADAHAIHARIRDLMIRAQEELLAVQQERAA